MHIGCGSPSSSWVFLLSVCIASSCSKEPARPGSARDTAPTGAQTNEGGTPVGTKTGPAAGKAGGSVRVVRTDDGWRLLRNGKPFYVKGAGGQASLEELVRAGGNSIRTWGADDLDGLLDKAHGLGLTVTVGIWLGHERHGFDYTDFAKVAAQQESARKAILRYKDHEALLMWGIGNEMEGYKSGDNPAIWNAVNGIAAVAKRLDPNHPTMTVVAEIGGNRVKAINTFCPDVDIVGINSYGGVTSIPERYRKAGGVKPYVVTEYGPPGTWEVGRNAWGAVEEMSSTKKAGSYRRAYEALRKDRELNLGSYAFAWGSKVEATATWFGMFLPDGHRLAAVDAMTELWSGKPPANRCPEIRSMKIAGPGKVDPGATVRVALDRSDYEGGPLKVSWELLRDLSEYKTGGDAVPKPPSFPDALVDERHDGVTLRMPKGGGRYRLLAYVRDGHGGAATANVPLLVTGPEALIEAAKTSLPFVVYGDGQAKPPYVASGWMGDHGAITMDDKCTDRPRDGGTCIKASFGKADGWGGVVWQHPDNDWGDRPGGFDIEGARSLAFWARGAGGGEKVKFGFGMIGADKKYHDSAKGEMEVTLTRDWKRYTIDLSGKDMTRIKSGFYWVVGGAGKPIAFYLDDVSYVAE